MKETDPAVQKTDIALERYIAELKRAGVDPQPYVDFLKNLISEDQHLPEQT